MLQDLWKKREQLEAKKAKLDLEDDDGHSAFGRRIYAVEGKIADIMPQSVEECLLHARLIATVYCDEFNSHWADKQDTRLAKSLLAGLERLAGEVS